MLEIDKMDDNINYLKILEDERERIATELHDTTIQELVHSIHQVDLIKHYINKDIVQANLEITSLYKNLKNTISNMRNIVHNLSPMSLKDLGFIHCIEENLYQIQKNHNLNTHVHIDPDFDNLDEERLLLVYRIISELLNNCMKHASAKNFYLDITYIKLNNNFVLMVEDDGIGCDTNNINHLHHYGLKIVSDRIEKLCGSWKIKTKVNEGFHVLINIPKHKTGEVIYENKGIIS